MDKEILIKLLQLQFQHNHKIRAFQGKINLDYFEIDLLGVVLDAVGVPADNTIEQMEKYGYSDWFKQPDSFSRDWYYEEFKNRVKQGSYEECQSYLRIVRTSPQPGYPLEAGPAATGLAPS